MKNKIPSIFALLLFALSLSFFIAANSLNNYNTNSERTGDCYGCGSYDLCDNGGAVTGWTNCYSDPGATPPDNCIVHGSDQCGAQGLPNPTN